MRDIVQTDSGGTWRLVEDLKEAANVGNLSAMPGVEVYFEGDRKEGRTCAYYALFAADSARVDVVARVGGPVASHGFRSPHPDFSEDIRILESAIGHGIEETNEVEPAEPIGPGGP